MPKRTLIISQSQLDEIVGANAAYLDNASHDFRYNGNNEVNADGCVSGDYAANKATGDKHTKAIGDRGLGAKGYGMYGISGYGVPMGGRFLGEEYKDPTITNATFATGKNDENGNPVQRSAGSMATEKARYGAAQALANSTDPSEKKRGESTMKTMEKNDPNLKFEIGAYDNLQKTAATGRENKKELLGQPLINRNTASGTNGGEKTDNGIITYDLAAGKPTS